MPAASFGSETRAESGGLVGVEDTKSEDLTPSPLTPSDVKKQDLTPTPLSVSGGVT